MCVGTYTCIYLSCVCEWVCRSLFSSVLFWRGSMETSLDAGKGVCCVVDLGGEYDLGANRSRPRCLFERRGEESFD